MDIPHDVVVVSLLQRLEESVQAAIRHRQIIDLAAEDELVVDATNCCRLRVMRE